MLQVGVRRRSGSRLLMSVTAESEPCDYFGAKVQINPVWVTTSLIWTKCAVLCDLCWKTYRAEWLNVSDNRCFFSTVVLISSSRDNIPTVNDMAPHRTGFICTWVCLHSNVCQGLIRQLSRQIYKSLHEPIFWGLLPKVSRQTPLSSITFHLQVYTNKWTWFSCRRQLY